MLLPEQSGWVNWLQKWFFPFLMIGTAVNAGALFITILEPDGALYATITKTMAQSGDFINLKLHGKDWLDKPHFPFWLTALSFQLFGIHTFAYKLPALLFWALGALYTYLLAKRLYGKPVAQLATLIYVSAAHLVISNNDVRAEPYLTGLVIGSVFHFYKAAQKNFSLDLIAGSLLAALAVMTKGPFVLITIGAGFVVDAFLKKEIKQLFHFRWFLALLLIALFILPELYCLYLQFDTHPEKIVFGKTHVSGIRFFFWDSQFGRFLNTGPIRGSGDPLFYLHTLLWAFLPWSLLLYAALFVFIKSAIRTSSLVREYITLGAALVTFLIFSLSRFQLPHYLNMLFPFFAIITANYLFNLNNKHTLSFVRWIQHLIIIALLVIVGAIIIFFRLTHPLLLLFILILSYILLFSLFRNRSLPAIFARCFGAAIVVYAFINFILYPALLKYQSGSEAAFVIKDTLKGELDQSVYMLTEYPDSYSLEFYVPQTVQFCNLNEAKTKKNALFFVPEKAAVSLMTNDPDFLLLQKFPHFHISQLTGKFINYNSRPGTLEYYMLVLKQ